MATNIDSEILWGTRMTLKNPECSRRREERTESATWALAILTGIVAIFTAALAVAAFLTMLQERQASKEQLGVRTWLYVEQRSDSDEMTVARKKLAQELDPYDPKKRSEIDDDSLEFFESVGALYNRKLLNKGLALAFITPLNTKRREKPSAFLEPDEMGCE